MTTVTVGTTKSDQTTTTESGETTTESSMSNKGPRIGDNNITETDMPTTTPIDGVVSLMTTISEGLPRSNDSETTTVSFDQKKNTTEATTLRTFETTTSPMETTTSKTFDETTVTSASKGNATKRPTTRFDTTLEVGNEQSTTKEISSTTTESMSTETTTTNQILTETTTSSEIIDGTTVNATVSKTVPMKDCSSQTDCAPNEKCINKKCFRICDTNENVTKGDECVQGTYAVNQIMNSTHFSLFAASDRILLDVVYRFSLQLSPLTIVRLLFRNYNNFFLSILSNKTL